MTSVTSRKCYYKIRYCHENVTTEFDFNYFTDLYKIARICDVRKVHTVHMLDI